MKRLARALVFVAVLGMPGAAGAADLKSHMAMYQATLKGAPANVTANGQIALSAVLRCKTWNFGQSMNLGIDANGKSAFLMVVGQEGEESSDGKSMTHKTMLMINGQRIETKGKGTTAGLGKAGKVEIEQGGVVRTVEIAAGTYFVAGAMGRMIAELSAGKKSFAIKAYDPATTYQVLDQTYTVVPSPFSAKPLPDDPNGLLAGKSWIVKSTVSVGGQTSETVLQVHASGVTSRILQNIGGVEVEFTLDNLIGFPPIGC